MELFDLENDPKTVEIEKEANSILEKYKGYKIDTNQEYELSASHLKDIKGKIKEVEDYQKSITKPINKSLKAIRDFFRTPLTRLTEAEKIIKSNMISYKREQERLRAEEEQKLREIQRKKEEKERDKLLRRSEKAKKDGNEEKAEELRQESEKVFVPLVHVPSAVTKVSGISTKKVWKFRIVDETKIPRQFLMPNDKAIQKIAGVMKIDGVEFYQEEIMSARAS